MKQESGKGMIKAFILLIIMIAIIVGICMSISKNIKTQKVDTVVSNMLTIKAKCKVFNENRIRTNKGEEELIGTKLSDIGKSEEQQNNNEEKKEEQSNEENKQESNEQENSNDEKDQEDSSEEKKETTSDNNKKNDKEDDLIKIVNNFKNTGIITEEEYAKYYVLTDKNLEDLKIKVKNEKNSYYLINYETNEVIITKGYEGKYKISQIEEENK